MTWLTGLGAWVFGSLGYAAIAAVVALAVLAHFFSKSVSLVAWMLAIAALALSSVGKDAVIANARADLEAAKGAAVGERASAQAMANSAAAAHRARMRIEEQTSARRIQAAEEAAKKAKDELPSATENLAFCVLSDDAIRMLNAGSVRPDTD